MEGCDCLVLRSPELRAGFAPEVGMVGYTLSHRGEELLGQRGGLAAYRERGSSFGLPLLHPWANRLSRRSFELDGRRLELDPSTAPVRLDANGLPIHGLLAASPDWELGACESGPERATLEARLDFGAELLAAFPFPHRLELTIELAGAELSVVATLSATADVAVPLSFGWHPYLTLPGVPRADWHVELPVRTRAVLDAQGIPTGREEPAGELSGPLGAQTWDDLFTALDTPAVFALEGGGRRIEVEFEAGYPLAQVYAPPGEDYVCFEPMTAPTDALVSGVGLRRVAPGESVTTRFALRLVPPRAGSGRAAPAS